MLSPVLQTTRDQQAHLIARQAQTEYLLRVLGFIAFHIPLVFLMRWNTDLATVHALLSLSVGLYWLVREQSPAKALYVIAYLTGAELLWRATGANVFWEFGKYANALLLLGLLIKYRLYNHADKTILLYFALLLPSVILLPSFDRDAISYVLSGPFALALATLVFSQARLTPTQLRPMMVVMVAPSVGMGALALSGIIAAGGQIYYGISEDIVSAGIGANQVSTALGLGSFAAFLYILLDRRSRLLQIIMAGLSLWLIAQAALTFSRGGVWTTMLAILALGFYLFRERRSRQLFLGSLAAAGLLMAFVVFPALDALSQSSLSARFQSLDPTGRDVLIQSDLDIFQNNPVLGVGPNQSRFYHELVFKASPGHTEYSRMLSEHGIFGLAALVVLFWVALQRVFGSSGAPTRLSELNRKAYAAGFTVWGLFYMVHAAMRLAAPSITFGLAAAQFVLDPEEEPQAESEYAESHSSYP